MEEFTFSLGTLLAVFGFSAAIVLCIGIAIGIHISKTETSRLQMENLILFMSFAFVLGSIVFQALGMLESFATVVVTMFSSVIFSWLLTKSSGKEEWKEHEQELALRSYRHIDYIESASKTAEKTIDQYIKDASGNISPEQKLVLSRAMDYIGYIHGGIRTCKMDWFDLMSKEGQSKFTPTESTDQIVVVDMSQEDA